MNINLSPLLAFFELIKNNSGPCFILLFAITFLPMKAWPKDPIPVYYATTLPAKDRQDALKEDGVDTVVFAKFKDFIEEVKGKDPSLVIAPSAFGKYYKEYKPALIFGEKSGLKYSYLLLALGDRWNAKNLSESKVGVVEEVDRDNLKEFLGDLLGVKFKMVKSVSKAEDLFPLLVFKSADIIVVSPSNYEKLKEQFTTSLTNVTKSKPVENPMVFVKESSNEAEAIEKLKGVSGKVLSALGFTKIETVGAKK